MATSNFYTQKGFALVVWNTNKALKDWDEEEQDFETYSNQETEDSVEWAEDFIRELNNDLLFHAVELKSGYYESFQFYVESTLPYGTESYEVEYLDNEDCQLNYDLNRSTLLRKHKAEINKINRALRKFAKDSNDCFCEIGIYARFSNGETMYQIVGA